MGTSNDYGAGASCLRALFICANVFFLVCGILGFCISIWGLAVGSTNDVVYGNDNIASSAILLVCSIVAVVIAGVGLAGACFMWRPLLIIYAIAIGVIALLQFISAILAFASTGKSREVIGDNMKNLIEKYRVLTNASDYDSSINSAVAAIQEAISCCGINNASDWITYNLEAVRQNNFVPPGNCECDSDLERDEDKCTRLSYQGRNVTISAIVWKNGCLDALTTFSNAVAIGVGLVAFFIFLFEVAFVVVAVVLAFCITSALNKARYV